VAMTWIEFVGLERRVSWKIQGNGFW